MHKAVTYYPSFFLFLFSYFSIFYCKILFNPYKYYSYLPKELLWTKELLCSLVCYLFVRNVYAFFTLKKTLKRAFKAILKSFKLLLIFYRIHFTFSFFALHTLQSRMRKSYPHFHKPFKFAILRGCSSLFTYTVFLILLFLLQPIMSNAQQNFSLSKYANRPTANNIIMDTVNNFFLLFFFSLNSIMLPLSKKL